MDKLFHILTEQKLTISVAESCTGGLLASELTNIIGSSRYFIGGIVAYNRNVKKNLLHVPDNIEVVSDKCAISMNQGLLNLIGGDIQVSVTGNIGKNNNPALSNVVFFSIFYLEIDYVFKIFLDNFSTREYSKKHIISIILEKLYSVLNE